MGPSWTHSSSIQTEDGAVYHGEIQSNQKSMWTAISKLVLGPALGKCNIAELLDTIFFFFFW